jgi:hypothetical protein
VTSGNSLNGNPITGIHFWGSSGKGVKPAIVFHGTVHAREWISTMVVEYMAYNLLTNYAKSTEIKGFIDKYDFYMFPVVNPDGESFLSDRALALGSSDILQASSTRSPTTDYGERTARALPAAPAWATILTVTGRTSGPSPAERRQTPVPRTSRARLRAMLPRQQRCLRGSPKSRTHKG